MIKLRTLLAEISSNDERFSKLFNFIKTKLPKVELRPAGNSYGGTTAEFINCDYYMKNISPSKAARNLIAPVLTAAGYTTDMNDSTAQVWENSNGHSILLDWMVDDDDDGYPTYLRITNRGDANESTEENQEFTINQQKYIDVYAEELLNPSNGRHDFTGKSPAFIKSWVIDNTRKWQDAGKSSRATEKYLMGGWSPASKATLRRLGLKTMSDFERWMRK